jgi:hypothetical protein
MGNHDSYSDRNFIPSRCSLGSSVVPSLQNTIYLSRLTGGTEPELADGCEHVALWPGDPWWRLPRSGRPRSKSTSRPYTEEGT